MNSLRSWAYSTLRKSEKFFKADMVYLAKGGIWLSLGVGLSMVISLATSIAFAHLFSKEAYGSYKFILSMVGIIGTLSLSGIGAAVTQSAARGFNSLKRGFQINTRWSFGMLAGGIGLGTYYFINHNFLLAFVFVMAGFLQPVISSSGLYSSYLLGRKDFKRNSLYSMIHNIIPALAILTTLLVTRSLVYVVIAYFVSLALVTFIIYRRVLYLSRLGSADEDPELLSYGLHLSAMGVIGQVASYLDKILIFHYLGAAQLAIYAFAIAPVEQLQSGKKIFGTLVMPKLNERSLSELQESTPRKSLLLTGYALVLIAIYFVLAPYFYQFLYPQYIDSVFYSQIYAFTLLIISGTLFNETMTAHKMKKELYLYRTIIPVVKIILFLVLLPILGLMGLVLTHVINVFISTALGYYFVKHPFKQVA